MIAANRLSSSLDPHDDSIPVSDLTALADPYLSDVSLASPPCAATAETGLTAVSLTAPATTTSAIARDSVQSRIRQRLLRMADGYRSRNALRQAIEIYFKLVEYHETTPEAQLACARLLEISEGYEHHGEYRLARGIYERLG